MKPYSLDETQLGLGDKVALLISRAMSTWVFICFLIVGMWDFIRKYNLLIAGQPLDIFNLGVSLYTLFVDLIILKAAISQRNMDRALSEKIDRTQENILRLEEAAITKIDRLDTKINMITSLLLGGNNGNYAFANRWTCTQGMADILPSH